MITAQLAWAGILDSAWSAGKPFSSKNPLFLQQSLFSCRGLLEKKFGPWKPRSKNRMLKICMLNLYFKKIKKTPLSRQMSESTVRGAIMKRAYRCSHWYLSIFSWVTVLLRRAFFFFFFCARKGLHTAQQPCELYMICCFIPHDVTPRMWKSCALLSILLFSVPISSGWEIRWKTQKCCAFPQSCSEKITKLPAPSSISDIHKPEFMQNRWSNVQCEDWPWLFFILWNSQIIFNLNRGYWCAVWLD